MQRILSLAAMAIAAATISGCTVSNDHATDAIEAQGMTNIVLGGPALFGCSSGDNDDEDFSRSFTATTASGRRVRGVVCAGLLKGATVRIMGRVQ